MFTTSLAVLLAFTDTYMLLPRFDTKMELPNRSDPLNLCTKSSLMSALLGLSIVVSWVGAIGFTLCALQAGIGGTSTKDPP